MKTNESSPYGRIVLVGARGFIGSAIAGILRQPDMVQEMAAFPSSDCDLTDLPKATEHLASALDESTLLIVCSGLKKQWGDSLELFSKNLLMVTNLCHILENSPVKRLVYFSSAEVYGESIDNLAIRETTPVAPTSYYGLAKFCAELLLRKTADHLGISLLTLRPPLVYGAGDTSRGYGPSGFIWSALAGETISIWGDGGELRSMIYIDDVAELTLRLSLGGYDGVVNLADSGSVSFAELLGLIDAMAPRGARSVSQPRTREKVDNRYDNALLLSLVPDFTFTPIEEGLRRTISQAGLLMEDIR